MDPGIGPRDWWRGALQQLASREVPRSGKTRGAPDGYRTPVQGVAEGSSVGSASAGLEGSTPSSRSPLSSRRLLRVTADGRPVYEDAA